MQHRKRGIHVFSIYYIKKNYIIFSQDISNCFEFFATVKSLNFATAFSYVFIYQS